MNLYHVVRPIASIVFRIYFKKISHVGSEKIPRGKPLIFSCNHPTGFFEPCVLACLNWDVEYHFITRGDMFEKPWVRRIFESLNMVPIFRFKDGFSNLKNNFATMEYIYKALAEKKSILIFSEGGTKTVKRLRPIQKGMARMAFGNYEAFGDLDLHLVPVCLTYTDPHRFRSELMIQFGEPIPLSRYYETYNQNNNKAINQLTSDIQNTMRPLLVEIEKPSNDDVTEKLFTLYRNTYPEPVFPIQKESKRRLMAHQEIADNINRMDDKSLEILKNKTDIYFSTLATKNIDDVAVAQPWHKNTRSLIVLGLGFVPFLIGWGAHYLAGWLATKIKNEKVPYLEFEGPVMAVVAMGLLLIQYIVLIVTALIINKWSVYAFIALLPFLGYYSLIYKELWHKYTACSHLNALDKTAVPQGQLIAAFRNEREELLKMVR
jgi:1-acyl-sn-glycerol-3-phosphate acyltransferase